jgi:hypothetical protein
MGHLRERSHRGRQFRRRDSGPIGLPVHLVTEAHVLDDLESPIAFLQILVVIAVATALACLPGAVAVGALLRIETPAPLAFGLMLAGSCVLCLKLLSLAYGIVTFNGDNSFAD